MHVAMVSVCLCWFFWTIFILHYIAFKNTHLIRCIRKYNNIHLKLLLVFFCCLLLHCMYIYIYNTYMYVCMYVSVQRERERERRNWHYIILYYICSGALFNTKERQQEEVGRKRSGPLFPLVNWCMKLKEKVTGLVGQLPCSIWLILFHIFYHSLFQLQSIK